MPSDVIDLRHRANVAELTEKMDAPCSRDELRACLRDLARLNRWFLGYRPLLRWLDSVSTRSASVSTTPAVKIPTDTPLHIVDMGCGYGDALRRVERWARTRGLTVELTGVDLNPDAIAIAAEATSRTSEIHWVAADVFSWQPDQPIHLVVSSLFTHHLAEADLIRFLKWMELHAELGWFVNDLSRAVVPYHLLRIFSKLAGLHHFVQHDGPVSIARSFIPEDWQRMCATAGLNSDAFSIQPSKPGRLCVSRIKTP